MARRTIKAALIDLSGTLHVEYQPIPGTIEALKRLQSNNIKVRFVTNTTKESKNVVLKHLTSAGFSIQPQDIFTSLTAGRELVERKKLRPYLMLEDTAEEDFEGICTDDPNAVVIGLAPSKFHYDNINKAFRLLFDGAPLIAIHKGRYYQTKKGLSLGPGPFVAGLEYATGTTAEVVGKPESLFFLEGLKPLNCSPSEAVMIGDDVRDDIDGAQKAGIAGILVKSGKYREGDEQKINPPPSVVCSNFPAAVDYILENN